MVWLWLGGALFASGMMIILGSLMATRAEQKIRENRLKLVSILKDQILVLSAYRDILKAKKYREYTEDDEIIDLKNEVLRHELDEMGIDNNLETRIPI